MAEYFSARPLRQNVSCPLTIVYTATVFLKPPGGSACQKPRFLPFQDNTMSKRPASNLSPFLCLLGLLMVGNLHAADAQVKALIVTGFDVGSHQWQESTKLIESVLNKTGRFDVTVSKNKEVFASRDLKTYHVVILSYGFWKETDPSDAAKNGLLAYAKNGGNVVALHFACSSFQDWKQYRDLLGRVWVKGTGGHGPYGEFTVNIQDKGHPITMGISDFKTEDELYAKLSGDAKIDVLATAHSKWSGKVEPIVFVKSYGKGRVVHNVLGHGLDSKQNTSYQKLLCRGVEWAATGKVTVD